jgi:hypothetical protein
VVLAANVMLLGRQCQPRDLGPGNLAAAFAHLKKFEILLLSLGKPVVNLGEFLV